MPAFTDALIDNFVMIQVVPSAGSQFSSPFLSTQYTSVCVCVRSMEDDNAAYDANRYSHRVRRFVSVSVRVPHARAHTGGLCGRVR